MKLLENKVALITGASKGIGRSIAQRFVEEGAKVAFTFLSSVERGKSLEDELSSLGGEAKGFQSDASSSMQAEKLINDVISHFGQIDIIVNNAGITKDTLMLRMSEEDFDSVINTNLKSVFNTTKHAQRSMLKQRSGSIINISSIFGTISKEKRAIYSATKFGIHGLTVGCSNDLARYNILVNTVSPGFVLTDLTKTNLSKLEQKVLSSQIPVKRMAETKDISSTVIFLLSDLNTYLTGQNIIVDGGFTNV